MPVVGVFAEELLRGGEAARDIVPDRREIAPLVAAAAIEPATPCEPLLRERQGRLGEIEHAPPRDTCGEALLRHVIAQGLARLRAPALHQIPGGIERNVIIEKAD